MSFYLLQAKLDHEFMKALVQKPEDRMITTTRLLKGIGGRLHYYFFCFGEYDIVLVYELPSDISSATLSMVLKASGSVSDVDVTPLLTTEEAVSAMNQAGDAMGIYQQPGLAATGS